MTQKRKRLSGPEKIAIVKRYLVERVPISDLCDEHELQPSQAYRWQAAIFEHGGDVGRNSHISMPQLYHIADFAQSQRGIR